MGPYYRIIIALFLLVCLVSLGRGNKNCERGDGVACRPTTSSSNTSPPTPSTPPARTELYTEIGTTMIAEGSSKSTPTQQTLTMLTSAPGSTNGTTQNVIWTTVPSEARPAALGVTTVYPGVTQDIGNGTTVDDVTDEEEFTTRELDVTSDGVDTTLGPRSEDLGKEETTLANEELTNKLTVIVTDTVNIIPTVDELPATSEYTDTSNTPIQEITDEVITTDSEMLISALNTELGEQTTTHFASPPETLTTSDHITIATLTTSERASTSLLQTSLPPTTPERATTAPLQTSLFTTSERASTSLLQTSLPPTTPERATTAPLQTSLFTTSERATTSVLHTSLPPATPERATTALQPTSRVSTGRPSTTHVPQTTDDDDDNNMNQISWTDLSEEEKENILTLSFNGITVEDWKQNYDLKFRQFLSNMLTSNTLRVEPEHIYYIAPTPWLHSNVLHVSILATYSSMKRSALPFVPLNETLGALSNLTALTDALGIPQAPNITEGIPDFILPATQPPTTQPPTTQPSTTRKPPPTIGFLSNPGLFISLVVIATVSIIIIIVGLIYLLCDRRRGRTGEYITNHTPRNSDLELGLDNPVMAENDKNVSNGNHLSSIKGDMESDMIVPYDNFTQEELMNYEVEDTHL